MPELAGCAICHEVIEKGQEYIDFPAMIANKRDPLIIFHYATCHQNCFTNHPLATAAQIRLAELDNFWKEPHLCTVCGLEISDLNNSLMLPRWTDDTDSKLYEFNYLKFHISHLSQWPRLNALYESLLDLKKSGTWEGQSLPRIIATVQIGRAKQHTRHDS